MRQGPYAYGQDGYARDHYDGYDAGPVEPAGWGGGVANSRVRQILWAATGAFGLLAWGVGLASAVPGFAVTIAVLAGAVAVTGLLPGQTVRGWLVVAMAVTACADAVTTTVTAGGAGWVLIVIDVLVTLQVVVAVSALLLEPRGSAATQTASENDYNVYAQYVRAYQEYAQQYGSYWPDQQLAAGDTRGTAAGTALGDQDAWADMQAKYAQHVSSPAPSQPTVRRAEGGVTGDAGMPGVDRTDRAYEARGQSAPGSGPTSPGGY